MKKALITLLMMLIPLIFCTAQTKDKGKLVESKNEMLDKIKKAANEFSKKPEEKKLSFMMDISGKDIPESIDDFTTYWHNPPHSQGYTGTCWSFSTTSYFESEIYRLTNRKVKLSEMFTVYYEYVEKAKEFVKTRGESYFAQGSEANAINHIWPVYGLVTEEAYNGKPEGQEFHNHKPMFNEMNSYLESCKERNAWNEKEILETIKSIMNYHMGTPPQKFEYQGKEYTPPEFYKFLEIDLNDYVDIISYMQFPYWEQVEYDVVDNWWHSKEYYNVPLDEFMTLLKKAVESELSICIGGDVSEPGRIPEKDVFLVPDFDIPSEYIDQYARQFRFSNETTTDDHGVHIVGYKKTGDDFWFLIKDSGSGSFNGRFKGYFMMHQDYVKLKIMDFMVHKSVAEELLEKFEK